MSVTYREPGLVGLAHTPEADPVLGEAAHYNGENPPSSGRPLAPLRELIDDRLLDALLEPGHTPSNQLVPSGPTTLRNAMPTGGSFDHSSGLRMMAHQGF